MSSDENRSRGCVILRKLSEGVLSSGLLNTVVTRGSTGRFYEDGQPTSTTILRTETR